MSKKLSTEAFGNILGKSCHSFPSANVPKSKDRAPATNTNGIIANSKSPKPFRKMPIALDANGPPFQVSEEELPPLLKGTMPPPIVENPFNSTSPKNSNASQSYWPVNLVQLVRETVNLPSCQPSKPEFKLF